MQHECVRLPLGGSGGGTGGLTVTINCVCQTSRRSPQLGQPPAPNVTKGTTNTCTAGWELLAINSVLASPHQSFERSLIAFPCKAICSSSFPCLCLIYPTYSLVNMPNIARRCHNNKTGNVHQASMKRCVWLPLCVCVCGYSQYVCNLFLFHQHFPTSSQGSKTPCGYWIVLLHFLFFFPWDEETEQYRTAAPTLHGHETISLHGTRPL